MTPLKTPVLQSGHLSHCQVTQQCWDQHLWLLRSEFPAVLTLAYDELQLKTPQPAVRAPPTEWVVIANPALLFTASSLALLIPKQIARHSCLTAHNTAWWLLTSAFCPASELAFPFASRTSLENSSVYACRRCLTSGAQHHLPK